MVRRAHANGRHLPRDVRGLVLPERGVPQRDRRPGDGPRHDLPEPPRRSAPVADRAELVLPPVGLPGAPRAPLRRAPRLRPARLPAQRDARLHPRRPPGLLDQPRADAGRLGDPVPDRRERRDRPARGRLVGPRGRHDLRLVRRADQLHHRRRLPGRPGRVRAVVAGRPPRHRQGHRPVPHDLLAGDALERRPRGAAPRLGPRLAPGRPRRADEQEPRQLPRPGRLRGGVRARRRALRRPRARCRSTRTPRSAGTGSSGATTPISPTTSATSSTGRCRWRTATSTASGRRRDRRRRRWRRPGRTRLAAYRRALEALPAPRGARRSSGSSSARRTGSSTPRSRGSSPRPPRRATRRPRSGCAASSATSSRPAGSSAWPPRRSCRRPRRGSSPSSATTTRTRPTATAGRRSSTSCAGAPTPASRDVTAPEPLFPRLEVEAEAS